MHELHLLRHGRSCVILREVTPSELKQEAVFLIHMVSIQIIVRVVLNDVWHTVLSYYMRNESLNTSHMCIMKEEVVLDMSLNLVILIIFTIQVSTRLYDKLFVWGELRLILHHPTHRLIVPIFNIELLTIIRVSLIIIGIYVIDMVLIVCLLDKLQVRRGLADEWLFTIVVYSIIFHYF